MKPLNITKKHLSIMRTSTQHLKYLFKAALIGSEIGKYKSSINFLNRIKEDLSRLL